MSTETRILLVENEPRIAEVVQQYLERDGHMVVWAATGGDDVCRRLRATSDVPIVMLTARDSEDDLVHGLTLGADDYVVKPFNPRELRARVRALLRRAQADSEPQVDVLERAGGRLVIDNGRRRVTLDGDAVELTESESCLLRTLARFPGRVYSRYELIDKVQGYDFEGYERTIDAHVKNLRRKLGEDARSPRLIRTVYGRGYAFVEDEK